MGLLITDMLVGQQYSSFEFGFYDDAGNRLAVYKFRTWATDAITTSKPWQNLSSDIINGPQSMSEVPVREDEAVLMTLQQAPVTWATPTYTVRLIFRGAVRWDWNVTFEVGMFPFYLDGTWTQF
jgi:hypothetical protein